MHNQMLLENIWEGGIKTAQSRMSKEVIRLLGLVLPLHTVCFTTGSAVKRSCIFPEGIELLPALPLGDVLAEELSSDIPFGSLIVILKDQNRTTSINQSDVSHQLGLLIGDALLNIIEDGLFPLEHETEALLIMAKSYCQLLDTPDFQKQQICSQSFHQALLQSLSEYWSVQPQSRSNICNPALQRSPKTASLKHCLKNVESCDWHRNPHQKSINLSQLYSKLYNRNDWKKSIVDAVLSEIRTDASHAYNH